MHAAEKGHATCVELLVEREEGMQESDGKTALMRAARNGHAEAVSLPVEKEEGMKTTREWNGFPPGSTALGVAEKTGRTAIACSQWIACSFLRVPSPRGSLLVGLPLCFVA